MSETFSQVVGSPHQSQLWHWAGIVQLLVDTKSLKEQIHNNILGNLFKNSAKSDSKLQGSLNCLW